MGPIIRYHVGVSNRNLYEQQLATLEMGFLDDHLRDEPYTKDEVVELLGYCCLTFGIQLTKKNTPRIIISSRRGVKTLGSFTWSSDGASTLWLSKEASVRPCVVLHEFAHYLVWRHYPTKSADHGPEFLCIYFRLLKDFMDVPLKKTLNRALDLGWEVLPKIPAGGKT